MRRTYKGDDPFGTEPMFDKADVAPSHRETRTKSPDKAVGTASCPECHSRTRIGLIAQGKHLVWRPHDLVTWSGARLPCRASGVPVCEKQPRREIFVCTCATRSPVPFLSTAQEESNE